MATVYQRHKELNANLSKAQLSTVGTAVAILFKESNASRIKIPINEKYGVWDYSDNFVPVIDSCIETILKPPQEPKPVIEKPKRKRISASKVKIDGK